MIPIPVAPLRTETHRALVHRDGGCTLEDIESSVYPEHPQGRALREARVNGARHVSLGYAARHLRMSAVDFSGLETGRMTFATESEWATALAMVRELAAPGADGGKEGER